MEFDLERVQTNVEQATTEDLLDRLTIYRAGMEAEALEMIERELRRRGIGPDEIEDHATDRQASSMILDDGTAATCGFCYRPAVCHGWGWHRFWGLVPLFPRTFFVCEMHREKVWTAAKAQDGIT